MCVCVYESVCVCVCRGSRGVPCFGSTAHCFRPGLKTVWPCSSEIVHLGTKEMCIRCAYHVVGGEIGAEFFAEFLRVIRRAVLSKN